MSELQDRFRAASGSAEAVFWRAPARPADMFRDLAAFPAWPPYAGEFGTDVRPHLTVDAASATVDLATTAALLADVVPVVVELDRLQLAWWESGRCHVMHEWALG